MLDRPDLQKRVEKKAENRIREMNRAKKVKV